MSKPPKTARPQPTKGKDPPRSIRVPDDEWQAWAELARDRGQSITAMIRERINRMIKGARKQ